MASTDTNTNITVEEVSLEALGICVVQPKGHVIKIEINDWANLIKDGDSLTTPLFKIDDNEFTITIYPYTKLCKDRHKLSTTIGIYFKHITERLDHCIKITGNFRIITPIGNYQSTLDSNGIWIKKPDFGIDMHNISIDNKNWPKLIVLVNYVLVDVWKNDKPVICDNPGCNNTVCIPNMLDCGHVYCENNSCQSVTKCKRCVEPTVKCICSKCSLTK